MILYIYNMFMLILCMIQGMVNKEQMGLFWVAAAIFSLASVIGKVMS